MSLQDAREQIGDLNLQVTIMTSGKTEIKSFSLSNFSFFDCCAHCQNCVLVLTYITANPSLFSLYSISEMGVLRQKLSEGEEERVQLERKVTELSATVSSTLASYAFLEQGLGAATTKYDHHNSTGLLIFCLPELFFWS